MERINQAQISLLDLDRARAPQMSSPASELSLRRLSDSEDQHLQSLLEQMAERYPHQDVSAAAEGYLWDYQRLALRYSLPEVQDALAEWRITPGARFFPRPDEIAEMIESMREKSRESRRAARQEQQKRDDIRVFWKWAAEWMEGTGNSEEELLRRFPSYRGTKTND